MSRMRVRSGVRSGTTAPVQGTGPSRGRGRGRIPDRPWSNRRSDRKRPICRRRGRGLPFAADARGAQHNEEGLRSRDPSVRQGRRREDCESVRHPGAPPGSRVTTTSRPTASSPVRSSLIWVDLPLPSPPSRVMKSPRSILPPSALAFQPVPPHSRYLRAAPSRPISPSWPTSRPATSGTSILFISGAETTSFARTSPLAMGAGSGPS